MTQRVRLESDKFQMLSHRLYDAIRMYFANFHPSTVFNATHASHDVTRDIYRYFQKDDYIPPIRFWSATNLSSKMMNDFRAVGNSIKHADKNPMYVVPISDQLARVYLLAAILDFHQLKDALLNEGIAKLHKYNSSPYEDEMGGIEKVLHKIFVERDAKWYRKRPPRIDAASSLMLDWYVATTLVDNTEKGKEFSYPSEHRLNFSARVWVSIEKMRKYTDIGEREDWIRRNTKDGVLQQIDAVCEPVLGLASLPDTMESDYYLEDVDISGIRIKHTRPANTISIYKPNTDIRLIVS